jgi:hypothetical protein
MNNSSSWSVLLLLALFSITSCYKAPQLDGFDQEKWRESLQECDPYRATTGVNLIMENKDLILTKSQNEITQLLGNPDRQLLQKRNRKFFYYALDCDKQKELNIRFNALGLAREIMVMDVE